MTEENKGRVHTFTLADGKMTITAVKGVPTFDEHDMDIVLDEEHLRLQGEGLNIDRLDLDQGIVEISGVLRALSYGKDVKMNILKRIFK